MDLKPGDKVKIKTNIAPYLDGKETKIVAIFGQIENGTILEVERVQDNFGYSYYYFLNRFLEKIEG